MKLKTVEFYNKLNSDVDHKTIICRVEEPNVIQKSWYEMNTNHAISKIIHFKGNIDDFSSYDAVKIGTKSYYITQMTSPGDKSLRAEVGS